jgi:Amt family ammonium transporter
MVLGVVLGFSSFFSVDFIKFRCHVDDALDVSSVHGVPGVVGALAIGFAASKTMNPDIEYEGIFLNGDVYLLGIQGLAIVVAAVWSGVWTYVIMKVLHRLMPVSTAHMENAYQADVTGLDQLDHDFAAYTMSSHIWRSNRTSSPLGSQDNLAGIEVQRPRAGRGSINSSRNEHAPLLNTPLLNGHHH